MSTYTRSELESSGQCHQKSIRALPLSSMLRVEPGLILIIGVASCAYTICEFSFRKIHLMMNSRNIQPAKILRCTVPRVLQESVLEELHAGDTGGHLGVDKTVHKLKQRFYWPSHFRDVENWCKTCHSCVTRKTPAPKSRGALSGIPSGSPMQLIFVDIVGPFPESNDGNKYILVVVDQFTKWSEAYPIPNQEATIVADVLTREWFFWFSSQECLHSDQKRQFESQLIRELCTILGNRKSKTTLKVMVLQRDSTVVSRSQTTPLLRRGGPGGLP